jgi:hypothetical protein
MSPTYTLSSHLCKNLFASLKERRASGESRKSSLVLSTPFTNPVLSPVATLDAKPSDFETSFKAGQAGVSWETTLSQPAYSDLRKVATK